MKALLCVRHCSSSYAIGKDAIDDLDDEDNVAKYLSAYAIKTHALWDWIKGQNVGPTISTVKTCVSLGTRANQVQMQNYSVEAWNYLRKWKHLPLKDAVLYHRTSPKRASASSSLSKICKRDRIQGVT
ncbi:hypothetical protein DPMN_104066 [Dreissena polymorpha]|uniref:Uncharacterized protein n=1 Tax=Dreissena polymorpha TaxID=45954 RepID=A0A9D4K2L3_DREPO|nr:hypothetical protein DPMN_104066 [Dreissena polymorpha]